MRASRADLVSLGATPALARQRTLEFQAHPVEWVRRILGIDLWPRQAEIVQSVADNERTTVRSCYGSGKTFVASAAALWFLYSHPFGEVLTTAPVFRSVRENLWGEMQRAYQGARYPLGAESVSWPNCRLSLAPKWKALGFATDRMERWSGFHADSTLVIVDEASGVSEMIFEAIEGAMSSGRKVRMLLISQGTQTTGTFYRSFHSDRSLYRQQSIAVWDTPNFAPAVLEEWEAAGKPREGFRWPNPNLVMPPWVEGRRVAWGEGTPLWMVRVEGSFPPADPWAIFALHDCEAAGYRDLPAEGDEQIGVDIARTGEDLTVLYAHRGPRIVDVATQAVTLGPQVEHMVVEMVHRTGITRIVGDADGVGGPVLDYIRAHHPEWNVGDFHGAASPGTQRDKERYLNLKAISYSGLAQRFRDGDVDLSRLPRETRETLIADLLSIRKLLDSRGRVQIEQKDDCKKRLGRSPDHADALMLAFAAPAGNYSAWRDYMRSRRPVPA
jgi:phage terminase large subunit